MCVVVLHCKCVRLQITTIETADQYIYTDSTLESIQLLSFWRINIEYKWHFLIINYATKMQQELY